MQFTESNFGQMVIFTGNVKYEDTEVI